MKQIDQLTTVYFWIHLLKEQETPEVGGKREEQGSSDRLVIKSKFSRSWGSPDTREAATAQS